MNFKDVSILTKLAMFLFIACAIMLFIVKPLTAEFYILIIAMALMLIVIVVSIIKIRKNIKDEDNK